MGLENLMRYISIDFSQFLPIHSLWFLVCSFTLHVVVSDVYWSCSFVFRLEWWFCSEREVGVCPLQRFSGRTQWWRLGLGWHSAFHFVLLSSSVWPIFRHSQNHMLSCCSCVCECLHNKCLHVAGLHLTSSLTVGGWAFPPLNYKPYSTAPQHKTTNKQKTNIPSRIFPLPMIKYQTYKVQTPPK